MKTIRSYFFVIFISMLLLVAFSSDETTGPDSQNGTLTVLITDAAADYDSVIIYFSEISAHIDSQWVSVQGDTMRVDLLQWSNGRAFKIGSAQVPAGRYTQVRIKIDAAKIGVKDTVFNLDVPSGAKTGLKLGPQFTISPGLDYELVVAFNVCRSIVTTGSPDNPTGYKLKPHLRMISRAKSGSISGMVTNPEDAPQAHAIKENETITTSLVDTTSGYFMLGFLPAGDYRIVIEDTLGRNYSREGVPVKIGENNDLGEITLQP